MAGHSKWANIQHRKAAVDAKRGKIFTKVIKEITVSARLGSGDPAGNPRLRQALAEARSNNVPNDTVERAIKKGTGELEGVAYEEYSYEGYGLGGVAVLVEAVTDNRNRTVSEIRHLFSRHGGNLGEAGCVAWMFDRKGFFSFDPESLDEEGFMELALAIGADDLSLESDAYTIQTAPEDFNRVLEELESRGVEPQTKQLAMIPQSTIAVEGDEAEKLLIFMEALEDHDDVQHAWANFEIDDDALAAGG